ncbi:glucose dehydrogenase [Massilia sp. Root351]|jgi:glucose/arabinose dehydrogenase|nr:glucose dehydrogenase [Massilia sp. Root351]
MLVLSLALAGLAACGGGGGGGSVSAPLVPAPPPVTAPPVTPPPTPPATVQLALQSVASGLAQPLYLTAPAGDNRLFVVERPGRIRIIANGTLLATPFLDISSRTSTTGERGLLSMAFHPQYAQNGSFFLYYTDLNGDIAVDRMKVSANNANLADPATAGRVITIPHREFSNHNGGQLAFGPDGYLYIGTGDGGGGGDPQRNAQNLGSLLGKLLRLDVGIIVPGQTYGIPSGNPYAGQAGRRGEIWAAGLRNPWRFSFDRADGLLYIADVGQEQREEVNAVAATQGGQNYGWNIMEGTACYNAASCDRAGLTLPVFEYLHGASDVNGCSITGGYVYRGAAIPELAGTYFYSDYCKGYLKSLVYRNGTVSAAQEWAVDNPGNVLSFGQDAQGELYVLAGGGQVYRIVRR